MSATAHKFIKQTKDGKKIKHALTRVRIDGQRFLLPLSRMITEYVENSKWIRFKRDLLIEYQCRYTNPPRILAMLSALQQIEIRRDAILHKQRIIGRTIENFVQSEDDFAI